MNCAITLYDDGLPQGVGIAPAAVGMIMDALNSSRTTHFRVLGYSPSTSGKSSAASILLQAEGVVRITCSRDELKSYVFLNQDDPRSLSHYCDEKHQTTGAAVAKLVRETHARLVILDDVQCWYEADTNSQKFRFLSLLPVNFLGLASVRDLGSNVEFTPSGFFKSFLGYEDFKLDSQLALGSIADFLGKRHPTIPRDVLNDIATVAIERTDGWTFHVVRSINQFLYWTGKEHGTLSNGQFVELYLTYLYSYARSLIVRNGEERRGSVNADLFNEETLEVLLSLRAVYPEEQIVSNFCKNKNLLTWRAQALRPLAGTGLVTERIEKELDGTSNSYIKIPSKFSYILGIAASTVGTDAPMLPILKAKDNPIEYALDFLGCVLPLVNIKHLKNADKELAWEGETSKAEVVWQHHLSGALSRVLHHRTQSFTMEFPAPDENGKTTRNELDFYLSSELKLAVELLVTKESTWSKKGVFAEHAAMFDSGQRYAHINYKLALVLAIMPVEPSPDLLREVSDRNNTSLKTQGKVCLVSIIHHSSDSNELVVYLPCSSIARPIKISLMEGRSHVAPTKVGMGGILEISWINARSNTQENLEQFTAATMRKREVSSDVTDGGCTKKIKRAERFIETLSY